MYDQWLNDCLIKYIEKDVFDSIINDAIYVLFSRYENSSRTVVKECYFCIRECHFDFFCWHC